MSDLDKLIEVVEGGTLQDQPYFGMPTATALYKSIPNWNDNKAVSAFNGSLDAAKALHEALLPGWVFVVSEGSASVLERGNGFATMEKHYSDNPARAWLLTILKAYRLQQGET